LPCQEAKRKRKCNTELAAKAVPLNEPLRELYLPAKKGKKYAASCEESQREKKKKKKKKKKKRKKKKKKKKKQHRKGHEFRIRAPLNVARQHLATSRRLLLMFAC